MTLEKLEEKTDKENRMKQYYVKAIKEYCVKTLSYTAIKKIVSIEDTMAVMIEKYNSNNYIEMENCMNVFKNKIDEVVNIIKIKNSREYTDESNLVENIIKSYINCMRGEYYYYKGFWFLEYKNNILESEDCLKKADEYYKNALFENNENSAIANQYIYNARVYVNQILHNYNKNKDSKKAKEFIDKAVIFSQKACENYGNTRYSNDYRNYGVNIELELKFRREYKKEKIKTVDWIKRMKEAYYQYEQSKSINNNDVKTLTCYLQIY